MDTSRIRKRSNQEARGRYRGTSGVRNVNPGVKGLSTSRLDADAALVYAPPWGGAANPVRVLEFWFLVYNPAISRENTRIRGKFFYVLTMIHEGPPSGAMHSPTAGSWGGAVSYERGIPAVAVWRRGSCPPAHPPLWRLGLLLSRLSMNPHRPKATKNTCMSLGQGVSC